MLKKIKNILGIEGVKIDISVPEEVKTKSGSVNGQIIFTSQTEQHISKIKVKLIEKYRRGRKDSKLINEYLLGSIELDVDIPIEADNSKTIDFELPFNRMLSEMDHYESKNFITRSIVRMAKKLKNVKSEYKIEASAKVKGTKLDPHIIKNIVLN